MSYSRASYAADATGRLELTLADEDRAPIPAARMTSILLTLRDAHTGTAIRSAVNALNVGDFTFDTVSGAWVWLIQPADTHPSTLDLPEVHHVADLTWSYTTVGGKPRVGKHQHELAIEPAAGGGLLLCNVNDVRAAGLGIRDEDEAEVATTCAAVSLRIERYCGRRFAYKVAEAELFSTTTSRYSFQLRRYPVERASVDFREALNNAAFGGAVPIQAEQFHVNEEDGIVTLMYREALRGMGQVRITYNGGLARETAAVPSDLRALAAMQARFDWRERGRRGQISVSGAGGSVAVDTAVEQLDAHDLIRAVRDGLDMHWRLIEASF